MPGGGPPAVPRAPLWLGVAGTLPFVLGAAAVALGPDWLRATAYFHLTNYAALLLAFLGAVLWGFSAAAAAPGAWYAAGAAPFALAWLSLAAVHPTLRSLLLIAGFAAAFALDARAVRAGIAPRWYLRLRKPLTAAALAGLGIAEIAAR